MPPKKGNAQGKGKKDARGVEDDGDFTLTGFGAQWNIGELMDMLDEYVICKAWLRVSNLEPGSKMRRPGAAGVRDWAARLKGRGITEDKHAFAVVLTNDSDEEEVERKAKEEMDKIVAAGLLDLFGTEKIQVGKLEYPGRLKDGGHRSKSLTKLSVVDSDRKDLYEWVPVVIYRRGVEKHTIVLSKVLNLSSKVGVNEDSLEKLTLCQGLMQQYWDDVWVGKLQGRYKREKKTFDANKHPWEYDLKVGKGGEAPKVADVLQFISESGRMSTTPGYYRHVIKSAMNVWGPPTTFLTQLFDEAEEENDKVGAIFYSWVGALVMK